MVRRSRTITDLQVQLQLLLVLHRRAALGQLPTTATAVRQYVHVLYVRTVHVLARSATTSI